MIVRKALPEDGEQMAAVQIAAWRERLSQWAPPWFVNGFKHDEQAEKYSQRAQDPDYHILVAIEEDRLMGFCALKPNTSPPVEFSHQISALYVHPAHERHGVGTALLTNMLDSSEQSQPIILWTFRDNVSARRLYERCGGKLLPYTEAADMDLDIPHVSYGWFLNSKAIS